MSFHLFLEKLTSHLSHPIDLVINENRSTMLNVLIRKKGYAKLSMHTMFLLAPDPVISAIANYIRGTRSKQTLIRDYIQKNICHLNYQKRLDPTTLDPVGLVHDLSHIYQQVHQDYFSRAPKLPITWYGKRGKKNKTRVTFGHYDGPLRLIRIHRLLDSSKVPAYFVASVVHHEMLHHEIPYDQNHQGRVCIHGPEFKRREKMFEHYHRAKAWEKQNQSLFFNK